MYMYIYKYTYWGEGFRVTGEGAGYSGADVLLVRVELVHHLTVLLAVRDHLAVLLAVMVLRHLRGRGLLRILLHCWKGFRGRDLRRLRDWDFRPPNFWGSEVGICGAATCWPLNAGVCARAWKRSKLCTYSLPTPHL